MAWQRKTFGRGQRRRGGTYVLVMGSSMVIAVIGIAAVTVLRVERRYTQGTSDFASARAYALSAVELAFDTIANDPSWRVNHPNGIWFNNRSIGIGTCTLQAVDPSDADLANNATDSLVLTGIGVQGDARYKLETTLVAEIPPLTCLEVSLHAGVDLAFTSATVNCDQIISANNNVSATSSSINADVEAVGIINGSSSSFFLGTTTMGIAPRTMPDTTVFDYYITNGTYINLADIPITAGGQEIQGVVLSPASNPYGAGTTNPEGIYVIDCLGQEMHIRNSRIVATLVLLNPGPLTSVQDSVNWEPAVANYPALLVGGSMNLEIASDPLVESSSATNFNPPGTPYLGVQDADTLDTYPSLIKGLVYVSGGLTTANYVTIDGVVVVGTTLTGTANLNLTYQPTFLNNPPPGFTAPPQMVIAPGSWRRVVN